VYNNTGTMLQQADPAHAAGHVEMAWTDVSTLAIFFDMYYQ